MKKYLLLVIILFFGSISAVAGTDLYTASVVVTSQSESDRRAAIPDAMIQVLQKNSGQRELPTSAALDDALNQAEQLLLSFGYQNIERIDPEGNVSTSLQLLASFIPAEIDKVMTDAKLPRWQQDRPAVQVWVVLDDGRERELKPVEYDYVWTAMEDVADLRGLPIIWPQLDEEQQQLIDMGMLWGGYTDYLVEKGAPADGVAIVAARRDGPLWRLRWSLLAGEQSWSWRTEDSDLMFAMVDGVHRMTDDMAMANSIEAIDQGVWQTGLTVGKLLSADDYSRCLNYLQSMRLVTSVDVMGAQPGKVHFRLQLNASPDHLTDAIERSSVLIPVRVDGESYYEFVR